MFVDRPGGQLFYDIVERTPGWLANPETIVFLHGVGAGHELWAGWLAALIDRYRIVLIDTRGCGRSAGIAGYEAWTLDGLSDDVLAVADHAGIGAFHVVGESAGDWAGGHVALSSNGTRVAVGASENDGNGPQSGHARVFEWDGGLQSWVQLGDDIDGEVQGHRSGIVALSSDGSRLAFGATSNGQAGAYAGHARVFEWDGGSASWIQLGDDIDGEGPGDYSGTSVALSSDGSRLAVGAIGNDNINGDDAGHVRVYSWQPPYWVRLGDDIDGESEGDNSGVSVAVSLDGTRLAIGAFYNDNANGEDAGHVRVYAGPIFSDGFESGSTSAWSVTVP